MKEYITMAHYPQDDVDLIMERHISNYGLCEECSTYSILVAYPCEIVKGVQ